MKTSTKEINQFLGINGGYVQRSHSSDRLRVVRAKRSGEHLFMLTIGGNYVPITEPTQVESASNCHDLLIVNP